MSKFKKNITGDIMRRNYLVTSISKQLNSNLLGTVSDMNKNDRILREKSRKDLYSIPGEEPSQGSEMSTISKQGHKSRQDRLPPLQHNFKNNSYYKAK